MEPEGSLPCSQEPAIDPCPEPDESCTHTPRSSLISILILFFHLRLCPLSDLFPSDLRKEIMSALLFSPMRAKCPPSHLTLIGHYSNIWPGVRVVKLRITLFFFSFL
jgi:hypothetical protein